jgi:hypothetical protein
VNFPVFVCTQFGQSIDIPDMIILSPVNELSDGVKLLCALVRLLHYYFVFDQLHPMLKVGPKLILSLFVPTVR